MVKEDTVNITNKRKIQSAGILKKRALLVVMSENYLGKSFILDNHEMVLGREDNSDIIIDDPLISKKHCRIFLNDEGHFQLEDLDSTNSTYLNGKILKKAVILNYGDRIIIGNTIIRFFHEEKFEAK
ncbi:MAG: FHA domain-containing protein [Spirochaetes bacterium]|nr:FHA domain-containing protein [Spirochaetota bacterium]